MKGREIANCLRVLWGSYSVLHNLEGNLRETYTIRVYTVALDAASRGALKREHIAAVARLGKHVERVPQWARMLDLLLERQRAAKLPATTKKRGPAYDWDKDPRIWTAAERDAWQRDYPAYRWDAFVTLMTMETRSLPPPDGVWRGGYVGDCRKPHETAEVFVRRMATPFADISDEDTAKYLEVPIEAVRAVRAEGRMA